MTDNNSQNEQPTNHADDHEPRIMIGIPYDSLLQFIGADPVPEDADPPELRPALVCDLDGTIRYSKGGNKFAKGVEDIAVFPDVEAKLWEFRKQHYVVLGITNQGGVAFGYKTPDQVKAEVDAMCDLFKRDPFHDIAGCYTHPKATDPFLRAPSLMRKPHYGMLVKLERRALEMGNVRIDWPNSIMVGDSREDQQCAERAQIRFIWAWDFFNRKPTDQQWNELVIGFKELPKDADHFPVCPSCGEDELLSYLITEDKRPLQDYINAGMYCIQCGHVVRQRE